MTMKWYNLKDEVIRDIKGVYIVCLPNPKFGKTDNPTGRHGNYKALDPTATMLFIPEQNMEHVETFVLNILCHFRISHTISRLSEVIDVHWKILQCIVEFCILNQHRFMEQKRCCSINTIKDIIISKVVLTDLIIHIKLYFNIPFLTPMEIDDAYSYYLNMDELKKIIYICDHNIR